MRGGGCNIEEALSEQVEEAEQRYNHLARRTARTLELVKKPRLSKVESQELSDLLEELDKLTEGALV